MGIAGASPGAKHPGLVGGGRRRHPGEGYRVTADINRDASM